MFKWPGAPSNSAPVHELADYAELICWQEGSTSNTALSKFLGRLGDNDYSGGVPEEDEADRVVEEAFGEIERRQEACLDGYPFKLVRQGSTLYEDNDATNNRQMIYKYLLLATRLNMNENRMHSGMDGTLLFERLSAEAAKEYFGARAKSLVFGTAVEKTGFADKINELCIELNEGEGFRNPNYALPTEKDGKLDVVVWKHFSDGLPGKLVGFGQCKTGTNYRDSLAQLQPDAFCKKWLQSQLALTPVRIFFVSEALSRSRWNSDAVDAGLLFDRCRLVDFCQDVSDDVFGRLLAWTKAAASATELPA